MSGHFCLARESAAAGRYLFELSAAAVGKLARDTLEGGGMEEGRITGNGWRTEQKWKSEKDLREEMEENDTKEVEEEKVTEQLMTVQAEVTMIDTDSLGR